MTFQTQPVVVISDGCSGSPHTDCGSRVVAHAGLNVLTQWLPSFAKKNPAYTGDELTAAITPVLVDALRVKQQEMLSGSPLLTDRFTDATLLAATVVDDKVVVVMFGDGYVCIEREGSQTIITKQYDQCAPAYLSYFIDPSKAEQYKSHGLLQHRRTYRVEDPGLTNRVSSDATVDCEAHLHQCFVFPVEKDLVSLSVSSDGLGSFSKRDCSTVVTMEDIILPTLRFGRRVLQGSFAKRKLLFLAKMDWNKKGLVHGDDLAVSTIGFLP